MAATPQLIHSLCWVRIASPVLMAYHENTVHIADLCICVWDSHQCPLSLPCQYQCLMQWLWPIPVSLVAAYLINIPPHEPGMVIHGQLMRHRRQVTLQYYCWQKVGIWHSKSVVSFIWVTALFTGGDCCHDDVTMSHSLVTVMPGDHSCRHWAQMSSHSLVCGAQHMTLCQSSENYPWWWEHGCDQ